MFWHSQKLSRKIVPIEARLEIFLLFNYSLTQARNRERECVCMGVCVCERERERERERRKTGLELNVILKFASKLEQELGVLFFFQFSAFSTFSILNSFARARAD